MKIFSLLLPAIILTAASCGSKESSESEPADAPVAVKQLEIAPRDSSLYQMGRRHAAYILNRYSHPDSICAQLLEIRARETDIRTRVDNDAADAYVYGFTTYIAENDKALADSIF